MWSLLGIVVVVGGFALRINPLLVIAAAAGVTGWAIGMPLLHVIEAFGAAFAKNRLIGIAFLVLPVIGLLERYGLQERAKTLIARLRGLTAGRLLLFYFLIRQVAAAFGVPFGGQAQVVRPLLAPMVEGAAETQAGRVSVARRYWLRAHAAAAENIGLFFAEDVFVAMSSVVLIQASLATFHVQTELLHLSLWAIPTALLAAAVHGTRLLMVDRVLKRDAAANAESEP